MKCSENLFNQKFEETRPRGRQIRKFLIVWVRVGTDNLFSCWFKRTFHHNNTARQHPIGRQRRSFVRSNSIFKNKTCSIGPLNFTCCQDHWYNDIANFLTSKDVKKLKVAFINFKGMLLNTDNMPPDKRNWKRAVKSVCCWHCFRLMDSRTAFTLGAVYIVWIITMMDGLRRWLCAGGQRTAVSRRGPGFNPGPG